MVLDQLVFEASKGATFEATQANARRARIPFLAFGDELYHSETGARVVREDADAPAMQDPSAEMSSGPERREVYLHPAEENAMSVLGHAWNAVTDALGPCNPSHAAEAAHHIHALQRMILANVAACAFPEKYRT